MHAMPEHATCDKGCEDRNEIEINGDESSESPPQSERKSLIKGRTNEASLCSIRSNALKLVESSGQPSSFDTAFLDGRKLNAVLIIL